MTSSATIENVSAIATNSVNGTSMKFSINRQSNYIDITRADLPGLTYRVSAFAVLGASSGMLVLFEAQRNSQRIAAVTVQMDTRGQSVRFDFQSGQCSASIEANDLSAAQIAAVVNTGGSSTTFVVDRSQEIVLFPPTTGPTFPVPCPIVESLRTFSEIEPALRNIIDTPSTQTTQQTQNGATVIFEENGNGSGNSKCERDRTNGWIKVGGELLVGVAAGAGVALTGGLGALIVGGLLSLGSGVVAGADANQTDNNYQDCTAGSGSGSGSGT